MELIEETGDSNKVELKPAKRQVPVKVSRRERRARAKQNKKTGRVIAKMFKILKPTEPLSREEVKTEAYLLYKQKYLTKEEARHVGCIIK